MDLPTVSGIALSTLSSRFPSVPGSVWPGLAAHLSGVDCELKAWEMKDLGLQAVSRVTEGGLDGALGRWEEMVTNFPANVGALAKLKGRLSVLSSYS